MQKKTFRLGNFFLFVITFCCISQSSANEIVHFPDSNFENLIREVLEIPKGDIYDTDLLQLKSLIGVNKGISDISGIEFATNLEVLELNHNQIINLNPIVNLDKISRLILPQNQISNLIPLENLNQLQYLDLSNNQIDDISPISGLTNLKTIDLSFNHIISIQALENLSNVYQLILKSNHIKNLKGIEHLYALNYLSLGQNNIHDITELENLTLLKTLHLHENSIENINPISQLLNLQSLWLYSNQLTNLQGIENCKKMTQLILSDNLISDISSLTNLDQLETLALDYNQIEDEGLLNLYPLKKLQNNTIYIQDYGPRYLDLRNNIGFSKQAIIDLSEQLPYFDYDHIIYDKNPNLPPYPPEILSCDDTIKIDDTLLLQVKAQDRDDDSLRIIIDWGENDSVIQTQFVKSASELSFHYQYKLPGMKTIRVYCEDQFLAIDSTLLAIDVITDTTSIKENTQEETTIIALYPNPFIDYLILNIQTFSKESQDIDIELYNLNGEEVLFIRKKYVQTGRIIKIPGLKKLPAGIYFFKLKNSQGQTIIKKLTHL